MNIKRPERLAITPGELAGIGPDLVIQLAQQSHAQEWVVIADPDALMARAKLLGLPLRCKPYNHAQFEPTHNGCISVVATQAEIPSKPGEASEHNAGYLLDCLNTAMDGCLQNKYSAMITGPLNKYVINNSGINFSGHTEYLAKYTKSPHVVMVLASEQLRVALATTHLPLKDVAEAITTTLLINTLHVLRDGLQHYFCANEPHILIAGLNPHAGEQGSLGTEEIDTIIPALNQMREKGYSLEGPLPADTLFTNRYLQRADAVLAMYHDQGLPVLKYQGFGNAANITLGLPIIRTSVDHGTAFDLAGTGQANPGSFQYALKVASAMAMHKQHENKSLC